MRPFKRHRKSLSSPVNFFEAQADARRATLRLVALFVLAVVTLIAAADLLIVFLLYANADIGEPDFRTFAGDLGAGIHVSIAFIVLFFVALGAIYKMAQLRGGGHVVAEMLGGHVVPHNTEDFLLRRYVNVVEEMAIASGVPVPRLYVMRNEVGINAFAAGLTTDDAVICVTQGCLDLLDRDKLQGVVAHEFSHIFNGDMRLNSNITSMLHGVLLLGLMGSYLLRVLFYGRVRTSKGSGFAALALLGGGLTVIGYGGTFFGNLIKATINRQREYLADASAVQFTRNPNGIAGALKMIGGYPYHARLISPAAPQASHFYFAAGINAIFATHPPIGKRIRRIQPDWDGTYPKVTPKWHKPRTEEIVDGKKEAAPDKVAATMAVAGALNQLATFEVPGDRQIAGTSGLIEAIPQALKSAARDPFTARALIYAMLLDSDAAIKHSQLETIRSRSEEGVFGNVGNLNKLLNMQPRDYYRVLIDMAVPTLRSLSRIQMRRFLGVMTELIRADNHMSVFEWTVSTIITNALETELDPVRRMVFNRLLQQHIIQVRVVLSMLAYINATDETAARQAFYQGARIAGLEGVEIYPANSLQFVTVNNALKMLDRLTPNDKKRLLEACIEVARSNQNIQISEIEVIRAIAASIHCPMPPVLI